jgi:hypothetical protein
MNRIFRVVEALLAPAILPLLVIGAISLASAQQAKDASLVPSDEYPVYNAVLANIQFSRIKPEKEVLALIVDDTLSLECGAESKNPILLNMCSPMLFPPTTPEDIRALLKDNFKFEKETWDDFLKKNAKIWRLQDQFVTSWKHGLTGSGIDPKSPSSPQWDSADCAFYLSRVGFNEEKTEAIVFVFFSSYMDRAPSSGDYFLLRQNKAAGWQIKGRANSLQSDEHSNEN